MPVTDRGPSNGIWVCTIVRIGIRTLRDKLGQAAEPGLLLHRADQRVERRPIWIRALRAGAVYRGSQRRQARLDGWGVVCRVRFQHPRDESIDTERQPAPSLALGQDSVDDGAQQR